LSNPEFIMMCKQILNSTLIGTVRVELVLNKSCIEVWPSRYDCEVAAVAFRSQAGCREEGLFQFTIGLTMIGLGHVDSNGPVQSAIGLG
jgi:hypothetical protein